MSRARLDLLAFGLALVLVASPAIGFISERNGAAAIMSIMCLAGLLAGRIAGVPGRVLLAGAFGLLVVLWIARCRCATGPPLPPRGASVILRHTVFSQLRWAHGRFRVIGDSRAAPLRSEATVSDRRCLVPCLKPGPTGPDPALARPLSRRMN